MRCIRKTHPLAPRGHPTFRSMPGKNSTRIRAKFLHPKAIRLHAGQAAPLIRCGHSDLGHMESHPIWNRNPEMERGPKRGKCCREELFVGHGEDTVLS